MSFVIPETHVPKKSDIPAVKKTSHCDLIINQSELISWSLRDGEVRFDSGGMIDEWRNAKGWVLAIVRGQGILYHQASSLGHLQSQILSEEELKQAKRNWSVRQSARASVPSAQSSHENSQGIPENIQSIPQNTQGTLENPENIQDTHENVQGTPQNTQGTESTPENIKSIPQSTPSTSQRCHQYTPSTQSDGKKKLNVSSHTSFLKTMRRTKVPAVFFVDLETKTTRYVGHIEYNESGMKVHASPHCYVQARLCPNQSQTPLRVLFHNGKQTWEANLPDKFGTYHLFGNGGIVRGKLILEE